MRAPARHLYLSATSVPGDADDWVDLIARELALWEAEGVVLDEIETILVGGGAASALGAAGIGGIQRMLGRSRLESLREWTVEAEPVDVTPELLAAWIEAGVNRVSLGVRSLRRSALELLQCRHDPVVARRAMDHLARSGIATWGVDLLYGLPTREDPDPTETLEEVVKLGVPHVSLYEATSDDLPGDLSWEDGPSDDLVADQYLALVRKLDEDGYDAYEMTAFARPGHASAHARAVLAGRPWLGLGPSAHSYVGGLRSWNLRDWMGYVASIIRGELPRAGSERDDEDERRAEVLWFRLRSAEGLALETLGSAAHDLHTLWVESGLAYDVPDRLRLTPEGWLRLDQLAVDLARKEAETDSPPPGLGRSASRSDLRP